ncbi:MAG: sulfatase-like hydrolase/transferase, partial [Bacilli bacterium]|nr:sulfatase-like hydrolase/transferase [Bacilli bacterium]
MRINYMKLFVVNYIYLIILELMFKLTILKTFDLGVLYIAIFSLPIALIITFISSLFEKRRINQIISIVIWIILFLVTCSEMVYYSFYKTICGLSALMYGGQVMDFAAEIGEHIINKSPFIIVLFVPLVSLIVLSIKKIILHDKYSKKETYALLFGGIFMAVTSLELDFKEIDRAKTLVFYSNDLMQSTNKLGINTAVAMDAYKLLVGFEENIELSNKLPFTLNEEDEYNITNIDFDSLIEKEKDSTLKKMHQYFAAEEPTNQNEYTGIFAGKNLIFIVAEGFYPIAVDKEVTPTLYKMANNGFIFNNYYQPIFNCSTSDGEFINSLSILPGVATCSMKETSDKYLPYSLGNIMKDYGYDANAYHGWTYTYYNRDKTMPNLGYTYYGYDRYK